MARPKNILPTRILTISTNQPLMDDLENVVASGWYGKNSPEAAERLIAKGIQELLKDGYTFQKGKNGKGKNGKTNQRRAS